MKNLRVKTLMNEVVEKLNNNQMSSLRGGGAKRNPIDHIGPVNKSPDNDKDDSDSNTFLLRSDAIKAAAEAAAKAAAAAAMAAEKEAEKKY